MQKKLFFHIGPHKTGTTSLQRLLHKHHKELLRFGIIYPTKNLGAWNAQHRLAFAAKRKTDRKAPQALSRAEEFASVLDEIKSSDADTAIISSEEFFASDNDGIQFLRDSLHAFSVFVVFYVRRQDEAYISTYTETTKMPRNARIAPITTHLNMPTRLSADLDIHGCASRWAAAFGKEAMIARPYDRTLNVPEDFMHCVNERRDNGATLPMEFFAEREDINPSPSLEAVELTRLFKSKSTDMEQRHLAAQLLQGYFRTARPAERLLSTADRRAILEFFRESNNELFREYFSSENKFTPELLLQGDEVAREALTLDDTARIIVELLEKQHEMEARLPEKKYGGVIAAARRLGLVRGS